MISISAITQNTSGSIVINYDLESDIRNNTARISRIATLDGGSTITHSGYSDSDRTLSISGRINKTNSEVLWDLFENETFMLFSINDGLYLGVIQSLDIDNGELSLTILIKNKEN